MELVRFGNKGTVEGNTGCCAIDVIQGFYVRTDGFAKIPRFFGDSPDRPILKGGEQVHYGPTNEEAFLQFLRTGTFDVTPMPDHVFLVALEHNQLEQREGRAWLKLLKENGFEFIRTVNNSVYCGEDWGGEPHPVYLFGLFRNVSNSKIEDPFTPPAAWQDLPEPILTQDEMWNQVIKNQTWMEAPKEPTKRPAREHVF